MKTILKKSTGEYLHFLNGEFYTSEIPCIISSEATIESLIEYTKMIGGDVLDVSDAEIKECELIIK